MEVLLNIPETWNQLSATQFKNIVYQLECFQSLVKDSPETTNENATKLYLQVCKELLRHNSAKAIKTALEEIQPKAFAQITKFIYKSVERTKFTPSFKINKITYHAPATRLRNSTIAEFAYVDAVFYKWRQTHNPIWLNVLCAALYREASPTPTDIDQRKPFIKQAVDARADALSKLSYQNKISIAYTYEGCRNHIANTYPLIFPKPIKVEGEQTTPKPKKQKYVSFGEIILDKIEGDPSKLHVTNNVMLYDFLAIYNNDIKKLPKK